MRYAQASDIQITRESDTRFIIDVTHRPGFACIEKRGDMWVLDLLDPNEKGSPDIVTAYFTENAPKDVPIESYISGWLMVQDIQIPD